MTFKESQNNILKALQSQGWTISQGLKVNHAAKDETKLFFKAQSIYFGQSLNNALSLHIDSQDLKSLSLYSPSQIEAYLVNRLKSFSLKY